MPSPALAKFTDRMLEVKRLLSLCTQEDADYRIAKDNTSKDTALLRGALVLLCSHMEGFFEDLVSDAVDVYDKLASQVALVPDELRARQVMGASAKWDVKDPAKRWEALQQCSTHPLLNVNGPMVKGCMEAALHTDGFSNPGTGEIEALFKTIGIGEVWTVFGTIESDALFKKSMDVIVHRRNQIAHGKADATIVLSDLKLYVERAERLAEVFDVLVGCQLSANLSIPDCWADFEIALTE